MIRMNYKIRYKLCYELKILYLSHLKVHFWFNIKSSAMPFTIQEKARILSQYHRERRMQLTQRWVISLKHKSAQYRSDIFRWEQHFMQSGNLGQRGGNGRLSHNASTHLTVSGDGARNAHIRPKNFQLIIFLSSSSLLRFAC